MFQACSKHVPRMFLACSWHLPPLVSPAHTQHSCPQRCPIHHRRQKSRQSYSSLSCLAESPIRSGLILALARHMRISLPLCHLPFKIGYRLPACNHSLPMLPFVGDKHVLLSQIKNVQVRPPSIWNGSWRIWGSGPRTWFPLDGARPNRDSIFVAYVRCAFVRVDFTLEHSKQVTEIFKGLGLLHGGNSLS
jgi:hypothetical protein